MLRWIAIAWTLFCMFGCATAVHYENSVASSFIVWALIWAIIGLAITRIGKLFDSNTTP